MARLQKHIKKYTSGIYAFRVAVLLVLLLLGCLALHTMFPAALPDNTDVAIAYQQKNQTILLQLSAALKGLPIAGTVKLRYPTDQTYDLQVPLKPHANMRQQIKVAELQKGNWKVGVFFTAGDETYYAEKTILIE